ncbi:AraC family transcriptional regulator [Ruminococcus sp. NK3A76]|uniref:AraC family transcriptional regulator n=1 Tax=Ruminococcus sp. NK3A76 TaxID=877411 RepID=UPI00049141F8|nr:AraC family transcriptional regulator [Ruminococcus sp. NK3A76]
MKETMDKQVAYLEYLNRENSFHHHRYDDDMRKFELLKNGDMRSVEEAGRNMRSGEVGHLSDDPIKNMLYLNICHVTLCTRFAIEGGMDAEKAYNASDLFIQHCDKAKSVEELYDLHLEMTEYFTKQAAAAKKASVYSKQIVLCIDYIQRHLHEAIVVRELAQMVGLNESYLSVLFRRETGVTLTEYVILKRMEAAENMLKYSDFTLSEISDILHFASYSHFARTFRKYYDTSPKRYRDSHYRTTVMTE